MTADRRVGRTRSVLLWSCVGLIGLSWAGCTWIGGHARPGWIDGADSGYPPAHYLIGVGQADNRSSAADQAYAAVARIFKAEVDARAKDWESYFVIEHRGSTNAERRLTLETVTRVSTEKILENVRIAETWQDPRKGLHYALAVMNRSQAEASLTDRMSALDKAVEADVDESRRTADKLVKIRNLRRASRNLVLREAYNADLRVIRPSGLGVAPPYEVRELSDELERFLLTNLVTAVRLSGDHAEPLQRALTEGLIREGITVTAGITDGAGTMPELLVRGTVRLFSIQVHDPHFKYVRWCSDFEVTEAATERILGAVSRGGKEGHLTEKEAMAKAVRVIQRELSAEVATMVASHIFGEASLPMPEGMPAGCPRGESWEESTR